MQSRIKDPACKNFVLKLKAHILPHIAAIHGADVPDLSEDDLLCLSQLNHVLFHGNKIYRYHLLRINYTTYDLQCGSDIINPRTDHWDIMLLSNLDGHEHPFCYAQIFDIFIANIIYTGPGSKDFWPHWIQFFWVRWFEVKEDNTASLRWE
ncbi:hypothetical protein JVT61DRAFT_6745 [Boletus reticuloceps]|uniref:Uncharacterized protein n=1 Tax=Boletus reticuloceps TaxID=495285 RepID=A0A8I2YJY2_9AGAM|nr:hypothetical protein JVT61DRAFT_6745 [Boletus reticuloceps]